MNRPSTSTLTISSTHFATETVTVTKADVQATPTTMMPKATTTVLYKFVTVTSTVSCLNFTFPNSGTPRRRLQPEHIFVDQGYENPQLDAVEVPEVDVNPIAMPSIANFNCKQQGTATLYTTTIFSSVTEDITETETVTVVMPPYQHGYSNPR
jgi:hypothetical protein